MRMPWRKPSSNEWMMYWESGNGCAASKGSRWLAGAQHIEIVTSR